MVASTDIGTPAELPFPIFRISSNVERYMLFDINVITWLRKTHHILGVLTGTLPQAPQQNVFLGLPLELMPEEARLLIEKRLAYIVIDEVWHRSKLRSASEYPRRYIDALVRDGVQAAQASRKAKLETTQEALRRLTLEPATADDKKDRSRSSTVADNQTGSLFDCDENGTTTPSKPRPEKADEAWTITPTTASQMLPKPPNDPDIPLPQVKESSYAVFKYLHHNGYFMSPGLRFGCEFTAYPGDPLRYHSHFLSVSADWDEQFDLLDMVGGGRLGTGVKKGYLIGGVEPGKTLGEQRTRTFCIEWGGM